MISVRTRLIQSWKLRSFPVEARRKVAWRCEAGLGGEWPVRRGLAGLGRAWIGRAGMTGHGVAVFGWAGFGRHGEVSPGTAEHGVGWQARRGAERLSAVRFVKAGVAR